MSKVLRYCLVILLVCFFSASVTLAAEQTKTQDQKKDQTKDQTQQRDESCQTLISNQNIGFELAASQTRNRNQTREQDPKGDQTQEQKQDRTCQS